MLAPNWLIVQSLKSVKKLIRPVTCKGKPTSTTSELPHVPKTSPYVTTDDIKEEKKQNDKPVHILAVPVLRSLPPRVPCVTTNIPNVPANVTPASSNIVGLLVITDTTAVVGCTARVNQPTGQTGTPQPLS